jgi:hypothetical protein
MINQEILKYLQTSSDISIEAISGLNNSLISELSNAMFSNVQPLYPTVESSDILETIEYFLNSISSSTALELSLNEFPEALISKIQKDIDSILKKYKTELTYFPDGLDDYSKKLLEPYSERIQKICEPLIKNQYNNMLDQKTWNNKPESDNSTVLNFDNIPEIFRNMKTLNIIGVQPMNGPIGLNMHKDITDNGIIFKDITVEARSRRSRRMMGDDISILSNEFDNEMLNIISDKIQPLTINDSSFENIVSKMADDFKTSLSILLSKKLYDKHKEFLDSAQDWIVTIYDGQLVRKDDVDGRNDCIITKNVPNNDISSGIIFSPFASIMNVGNLILESGEVVQSTMTRFGLTVLDNLNEYYKIIYVD